MPTKKYAKLQSMHIIKCTPRKQSDENQGVCAQCTQLGGFNESKTIEIKVQYVCIVHSKKQWTCAQC